MPLDYVEQYRNAAKIDEKSKAQTVKIICELLWSDAAFYKAVVNYAQTARRDIDWQPEGENPQQII